MGKDCKTPEAAAAAFGVGKIVRHLFVCGGPDCCSREEGDETWDYVKRRMKELTSPGPTGRRTARGCKCLRICTGGPIAVVYPEGTWYRDVTPEERRADHPGARASAAASSRILCFARNPCWSAPDGAGKFRTMEAGAVVQAWGLILQGHRPNLSIEITRECPLRCPGCYAYGDTHLGGDVVLRQLADFKGQELIDGVLDVVASSQAAASVDRRRRAARPVSRARRAAAAAHGAWACTRRSSRARCVRFPRAGRTCRSFRCASRSTGLQPEHDVRRAPATYDRILKHIKGQHVTVHCTITRQQTRPGYVTEFTDFWAKLAGRQAHLVQPVHAAERRAVAGDAAARGSRSASSTRSRRCIAREPKLHDMRPSVVHGYLHPPQNPDECIFAKTTACLSADLEADDHAVPVRRRSGLHAVRLHRVGRARRRRRLPARRRACRCGRSSTGRSRSGRRVRSLRGESNGITVDRRSPPATSTTPDDAPLTGECRELM